MLHFPSSNKCYFIKVPTGFFPDSRPPHKVRYSKGSRLSGENPLDRVSARKKEHRQYQGAFCICTHFATVDHAGHASVRESRCRVHLRRAPHPYVVNPRDRRHSRALVCSSCSLATIPLRKEKTAHSQVQKRDPRICILETSAIFGFSYVAYTGMCRWTASRDRSVGLCPGYIILGESGPKQGPNLS